MKNSWITFYFEQINKSNIYYVRISVYFRANWLHSFSQFLFVIGNSPFLNIEKFPKFLNPSRLITPYFLSFFFLRIFHKFLKFFFAEENFERFVLTRYEAAAWFFPESDTKSRPMESNRLISYRLMERPILFQGGFLTILLFYATFLRDTPSCQLVYWIYSQ